jgi:hypothetical protein
MLVPTKFTKLEESTIFKMRSILANKKDGETVLEVFSRTKDYFSDASEFLHALDILFVLDLLDVQSNDGVIMYA